MVRLIPTRPYSARPLPVSSSAPTTANSGLPQGSVLGPILFIAYAAELLHVIKRHQLTPHAYTDDSQIYGFCRPLEVNSLAARVSACIDEVSEWTRVNRLQLNHSKTEIIWFSSTRRQHQIPTEPVRIGNAMVQPVVSVRDLGVHLDADVTMTTHVMATVTWVTTHVTG